jgi:squalene-hopene/tetraprenyl-beta-curcumene cyclase
MPTAPATISSEAALPGEVTGQARAGSVYGRAKRATAAAAAALLAKQRTVPWGGRTGEGPHWCAELEGDSILSSEYLLMKFILGQEGETAEWGRLRRIANHLRLTQRADGSWGQYPGSPMDLSATVKGYFGLKLMGDPVGAPHMERARARVLGAGGAERINTFSMFYLAALGQVSWEACPAIPPQVVLLPRWFPFHLSKVAAWTRTMILPLALCSALQPVRRLPENLGCGELFVAPLARGRMAKRFDGQPLTWNNFFLAVDRLMKWCRRAGVTPLRERALELAEAWILERMDPGTTEGLGAIFPPMVYAQVALKARGFGRDHPVIRQAERDLDAFIIDHPHPDPRLDHTRLQPCFSPVWDTAIALDALAEAGHTAAADPRVAAACDWLRAREIRRAGDWVENLRPADRHLRPGVDVACFAFEYKNDWYPDVDDTCMVARALHRAGDRPGETANRETAARAVKFLLAMQNDDGGWAAFDRTRDRAWMEAVPFADHNAMQDPTCSDVTGRVVESLAACGLGPSHPAVRRAVGYLLSTQRPEGCWWGRWGVNFIYGTWQAVNGLVYGGVAKEHPALLRVREWLLGRQNPDGGFGESANSYLDESQMARGPSTASQTAWAMITLMHLLPRDHPAVLGAAAYLCDEQLEAEHRPFTVAEGAPAHAATDPISDVAGGWREHWWTGTGFPKVFYLRYHLYRHSFPLKALARFVREGEGAEESAGGGPG